MNELLSMLRIENVMIALTLTLVIFCYRNRVELIPLKRDLLMDLRQFFYQFKYGRKAARVYALSAFKKNINLGELEVKRGYTIKIDAPKHNRTLEGKFLGMDEDFCIYILLDENECAIYEIEHLTPKDIIYIKPN